MGLIEWWVFGVLGLWVRYYEAEVTYLQMPGMMSQQDDVMSHGPWPGGANPKSHRRK